MCLHEDENIKALKNGFDLRGGKAGVIRWITVEWAWLDSREKQLSTEAC